MSANKPINKMIDPVCGMAVDPSTAAAKTCHGGIQIYFCAEGCRDAFIANPERFTEVKRKGIWQRFLVRMEKATGGRPMKCH